jgi:hypothetical protein
MSHVELLLLPVDGSVNRPPSDPQSTEQNGAAKVVFDGNFPFRESLVHGLAVTVTIVLFYLNITETVWRDNFDHDLDSETISKQWQLYAKLHELLMLSSLSFIVLCQMRRLLARQRGISFSHLSAAYRAQSPAMMIESGAWFLGNGSSLSFGNLLSLVCLLSLVLGPASAILMVPSLNWISVKHPFSARELFVHLTGSEAALWPMHLSATDSDLAKRCLQQDPFPKMTDYCPTARYPAILNWVSHFYSYGC